MARSSQPGANHENARRPAVLCMNRLSGGAAQENVIIRNSNPASLFAKMLKSQPGRRNDTCGVAVRYVHAAMPSMLPRGLVETMPHSRNLFLQFEGSKEDGVRNRGTFSGMATEISAYSFIQQRERERDAASDTR